MRNDKIVKKTIIEAKKSQGNSLDSFKLWAEKDPYPKHHMTSEAGKSEPWYVRTYNAAENAVIGFVLDVIAAVKAILKEVM